MNDFRAFEVYYFEQLGAYFCEECKWTGYDFEDQSSDDGSVEYSGGKPLGAGPCTLQGNPAAFARMKRQREEQDWEENSSEGSSEYSEEGSSSSSREELGLPTTLLATRTAPQQAAATAGAARLRNLRDIGRLRKAFPDFCSHQLLYFHVLASPSRACNSQIDEQGCCFIGGKRRSHDCPEGLELIGLEALE